MNIGRVTIQDRLAQFLTEENISTQKFERQCNLGVGAASKLTQKSYATTYARIAKAFPQLNIDWLKTGEGQMYSPISTTDIDVSFKMSGQSQMAVGNITNIGDAKIQIAVLQERIKAHVKKIISRILGDERLHLEALKKIFEELTG